MGSKCANSVVVHDSLELGKLGELSGIPMYGLVLVVIKLWGWCRGEFGRV